MFTEIWNAAKKEGFSEWVQERKIPQIERMRGLHQNPGHHPEGDVFEHVIAALEDYKGNDPLVKVSILFHDYGKIFTANPSEKGDWCNFYNHDKDGVAPFLSFAEEAGFPENIREVVAFVIENHMRFYKIAEMKRAKVRRLVESPYWNVLTKVAYHDDHCRGGSVFSKEEYMENYRRAMTVRREKKG